MLIEKEKHLQDEDAFLYTTHLRIFQQTSHLG